MSTTLDVVRRFYARLITARGEVDDARIVEAFASVERERFLGPPPWQIWVGKGYLSSETDDPVVLYQDFLIALAADKGIHNGEPSLHARSIGAASPKPGDVVIHIGAGTGYYTAVLACLVGECGRVHAFEIEPALASKATKNLSAYRSVTVHPKSAFDAKLPMADVVYVSAGATHVPAEWLDALAIGGRLVLPLVPDGGLGCMLLVTRVSGAGYAARVFSPAGFIPCIRSVGENRR